MAVTAKLNVCSFPQTLPIGLETIEMEPLQMWSSENVRTSAAWQVLKVSLPFEQETSDFQDTLRESPCEAGG